MKYLSLIAKIGIISLVSQFFVGLCFMFLHIAFYGELVGPPTWLFMWAGISLLVAGIGGLPIFFKMVLLDK